MTNFATLYMYLIRNHFSIDKFKTLKYETETISMFNFSDEATSKKNPSVEVGYISHIFHWQHPPPPFLAHLCSLCPIPTWLTTSKKNPSVELGYSPHIFHWQVPPKPISVSDTLAPLTPNETQGPIAPETFTSLDVWKVQAKSHYKYISKVSESYFGTL